MSRTHRCPTSPIAWRAVWSVFCLLVVVRASASTCTVVPAVPVANEWVTIHYDPTGGPLAGAAEIYLYRAFNGWAQIAGPDQRMQWNAASGDYTFSYRVPEAAFAIDCVFHDGNGLWDNHHTLDWHFAVAAAPLPPPAPEPPPLRANSSRSGVMMQGFYWDVPEGAWYPLLASKAPGLRNIADGEGIERIWFPPPSKGQSGRFSMGYDPYDYYDLGQYDQMGTVRTRFGTQAELKAAIAAYRAAGIACLADVVLNHRSGGAWELNPNNGQSYWTDFSAVASGRCTWNYDDFHPSSHEWSDEGVFAGFPDLCHAHRGVPGDPPYDLVEWGNWLMDTANAGFDGGWRFDFVKGIAPAMLREFRAGTGNPFAVIECWDGLPMIESYLRYAGGASAFDFPGYYTLRDVFNSPGGTGDLRHLVDPERSLAARQPERAVTFVANHDTDEITQHRMLAYAYILTTEGYPCLFWKDYFDRGYADFGGLAGNGIRPLVWIRGALGGGHPQIELLKSDSPDLLVYGTLAGTLEAPGFLVALNDHATNSLSASVQTHNPRLRGRTLRCYAWYSYASGQNAAPPDLVAAADGTVTIRAPALGYAVYGPSELAYPTWEASSSGSVELQIHQTRAGQSYELLVSDDPAGPQGWETAATLVGNGEGVTPVTVTVDSNQPRFWRVANAEP